MDDYLLLGGGLWLALQALALLLWRGWWQKAAWVSAAVMGAALVVATLGVLGGSNLAPIWVVFALPVCLAWILILWAARAVAWVIDRATTA